MLVTLWGSPRWANGGGAPNRLPASGFGNFATAAAVRFPWVRLWTAWNEPNSRTFATPGLAEPLRDARAQSRVRGAARGVRREQGRGRRHVAAQVAVGHVAARVHAGHARGARAARRVRPESRIPSAARETPTHAVVRALLHDGEPAGDPRRRDAHFGSKPLWLTEYGYQTNPPDRLLGVSYALQAKYLREAALRVWRQPGVTMLIHFLVRDEPSLGGWQSGLFSVGGSGEARLPRVCAAARRGVAPRLEHRALGAGAARLRARAPTCCSARSAAAGARSAATAKTSRAARSRGGRRFPPARRFASSRRRSAGPAAAAPHLLETPTMDTALRACICSPRPCGSAARSHSSSSPCRRCSGSRARRVRARCARSASAGGRSAGRRSASRS